MDHTGQYMYVFLLAGCEVCVSAIIICLGNFLCIKKKPEEPEAKLEMAVSAGEREGLNHDAGDKEVQETVEEAKKEENGKISASETSQGDVVDTVKESADEALAVNSETSL